MSELLPDRVRQVARANPEAVALADEDRALTYGQMLSESSAIAHGMLADYVHAKDRVAVIGGNSATHIESLLGVFLAGCCLVPLSTFLVAEAAARILDDAKVRLIIAMPEFRKIAEQAARLCMVPPEVITPDMLRAKGGGASGSQGLPIVEPDSEAIIVYSSGTTGMPKGIMGTHALRARQTQAFASVGSTAGRFTLLSTPIASNWTLAGTLSTLWSGGGVYITRKFDAEEYSVLAERLQPRVAFLVPTQIERLLQAKRFREARLPHDTVKLCAGAPLAPQHKLEFHHCWPGEFIEVYSSTESSVTTSLNVGLTPEKINSVGKPAEGSRVSIIDESGREVAPGEIGEIAGHSAFMMKGYFGRDDATAAIEWLHPDGTVFQRTGDLGFLDEDGFLHITGRKKDMIITGGFNVYPIDIEEVLMSHPAVRAAAVIGLPSEAWGETPFAVVELGQGESVQASDLLTWANERLAKTQRLSDLDLVDALPRGSLDKVLKQQLRERYAA